MHRSDSLRGWRRRIARRAIRKRLQPFATKCFANAQGPFTPATVIARLRQCYNSAG